MPTLNEAVNPIDSSVYERVEQPRVDKTPSIESPNPGFNPMLRCPLPPVGDGGRSDSLRQFYRNGVPLVRVLTPTK